MSISSAAERFRQRTAVARVTIGVDPQAAQAADDAAEALAAYLIEHQGRKRMSDPGIDQDEVAKLEQASAEAAAARDDTGLVVVLTCQGQEAYYEAMNEGRVRDWSVAMVNIDVARRSFTAVEEPTDTTTSVPGVDVPLHSGTVDLSWEDVQRHATTAEFAAIVEAGASLYLASADPAPFARRGTSSAAS